MRATTDTITQLRNRQVIAIANSIFVCIDANREDKSVSVAVPCPDGEAFIFKLSPHIELLKTILILVNDIWR